MSTYSCPACHAEGEPHRADCAMTTCNYCGQPLREGWPSGHSRSGLMICAYCSERLPACPVCFGTGLRLAGELRTLVAHDPCSECHGDGFIKADDGCPYSGYRSCDDPACPDCRERSRIAAEDRAERLAKDQAYAREWGMRP